MNETLTLLKSETKLLLRARISSHMPRIFQRHSRILQSPHKISMQEEFRVLK